MSSYKADFRTKVHTLDSRFQGNDVVIDLEPTPENHERVRRIVNRLEGWPILRVFYNQFLDLARENIKLFAEKKKKNKRLGKRGPYKKNAINHNSIIEKI